MTILVDTGAFYAVADDSDRNSARARAFFREKLTTDRFATTDAVVLETWTLLRNRLGWSAAFRFLENLRRSDIEVLRIDSADQEAAWRILNDYSDQELSLADALSFALMERHGIVHAFTFDKDFLLYRYGPKKKRAFSRWPAES